MSDSLLRLGWKAAVREASREALRMKLKLRKLRAMVALFRLLLKPVVRSL